MLDACLTYGSERELDKVVHRVLPMAFRAVGAAEELTILATAALQSSHARDSIGPQSRSPEPRQMMTSCVGASVDIDGRDLDLVVARRPSVLSPGLPGCQQRLPAGCQQVARLPGCQVARLPGCQRLPAVASGCQQRLPVTMCTYWQPRLPAGCQVASRVASLCIREALLGTRCIRLCVH